MLKPRKHFSLTAISCYIWAGLSFIFFLIAGIATGRGDFFAMAFFLPAGLICVGYLNWIIAKRDEKEEKYKDQKIKQLEKEIDELKKKK